MFPNFRHGFEFAMMDGLRAAFAARGCEVRLARRPAYPGQVSRLATHFGADVVLQVNRKRPLDPPLPVGVRHICWLQDPTDCQKVTSCFEEAKDGDLIYEMHPIEAVLGKRPEGSPDKGRILAPAADRRLIDAIRTDQTAEPKRDMVLVANMMGALDADPEEDMTVYLNLDEADFLDRYNKRRPEAERASAEEAQQLFHNQVASALAKTAIEVNELNFGETRLDQIEQAITAAADPAAPWQTGKNTTDFRLSFSRAINRALIARYMINVSEDVSLFGQSWDKWSEFRDYAGGVLRHQGQIIRENRASKIVVHDNPNGCNLHDRVFYALGTGCFTLIPASIWDSYPGGLFETLDPDKHYGQYTRDTFYEQAGRWLRDDGLRHSTAEAAMQVVMSHHTYDQRAEQILTDLKS